MLIKSALKHGNHCIKWLLKLLIKIIVGLLVENLFCRYFDFLENFMEYDCYNFETPSKNTLYTKNTLHKVLCKPEDRVATEEYRL